MGHERELYETLRLRILRDLHLEPHRSGRRLPSIRRLAETTRLDHRAVARVYARLRDEGLVEIRERSGVFLASGPDGRAARSEAAVWLAAVLGGAWERRIPLLELSRTLRRLNEFSRRCVWVVEHGVNTGFEEVCRDLGLAYRAIRVDPQDGRQPDAATIVKPLTGSALVITTPSLESVVRGAADGLATTVLVVEAGTPAFASGQSMAPHNVRRILETMVRLACALD
jgi:DNA-binding transcriptional regulator YhcF (GntR family)